MSNNVVELIQTFLKKVRGVNKESIKRELFKDLLNRLYIGHDDIISVVDRMTLGAEAVVLDIPRRDRLHRGSADTLYNKVIIEFENNLKTSLKHAKEQLAGYLLGRMRNGEGYNFTLVASDFEHWYCFAIDESCFDSLDSILEDQLILNSIPSAEFTLTEANSEDFYFWLDRFLFKEEKVRATLSRVEDAFGYRSSTFLECYKGLHEVFADARVQQSVEVSYQEWKNYLSIAYGSFEDSSRSFVIHTYLSVVSKMLAYVSLGREEFISDEEMRGIIDGSIFDRYNIANFVENDFFQWVHRDPFYHRLRAVFRTLAQEMSLFDFENVDEDVLKGVYQELIDLDTRHSLGEYYTPDWLCERIVQEFNFTLDDKILDPSCGSGSFLRAVIHRIWDLWPNATIDQINSCIYGIDIHPLSVQISKTTLLIAYGRRLLEAKRPIQFNVILANTILAPSGVRGLFGGEFTMQIDQKGYSLNTQLFDDTQMFDRTLEMCDDLAEQTQGNPSLSLDEFKAVWRAQSKAGGHNDQIAEGFHSIYEGFKKAKEEGRDSIWRFIVQNLYKPYFLQDKFDYVVGNPPWFTYSSINNPAYQAALSTLADTYALRSKQRGTFAHLEIAAIFLAHCTSYFLKREGKLAFVAPRSIFNAKQHANLQAGKVVGMRLTQFWDLAGVKPLFRVPSLVAFTERVIVKRAIPSAGLKGVVFEGKLPVANCTLAEASVSLSERETKFYFARQGASTAISERRGETGKARTNPYKRIFKAGATLRPRCFCFVDLAQEEPPDFEDRVLNVRTSPEILPETKKPWNDISFEGRVESQFLFLTAISRSILPFALYKPSMVVLPIIVGSPGDPPHSIRLISSREMLLKGFTNAARWFGECTKVWEQRRTTKNQAYSVEEYLNYQKKITSQDLSAPYVVLYNSSAKDANATLLIRSELPLKFIADHKTYALYTSNLDEAYYLVGVLNSNVANQKIKDFQTRGLFGPRDVHKKILEIFYPIYSERIELHSQISLQARLATEKANIYVAATMHDSGKNQLGRFRRAIRIHLKGELKQIDVLVRKLMAA
jgi:hypothetical protein